MRETYLVTGGAGFIASHLVDKLIKKGMRIVIVDNLSSGRKDNINKKAKFYKTNICSPSKISEIFSQEKPEVVFHYAAHIEARISVKNPIFDAKTNVMGLLNILDNCRKNKVRKIIFASSGGEVYGEPQKIPTPEDSPLNPVSPYGITKLAGEKYLFSYSKLFGISCVALRYGNVYGPRQNPNGEAGVVAIFINKILNEKQPLIHGSGEQIRDYIFIKDAIDATVAALRAGFNGVLNIGTGQGHSVLEIFRVITKLTGSRVLEKHTPLFTYGLNRSCLDVRKARRVLNWVPKYDLQKGLEETVQWYRNHQGL